MYSARLLDHFQNPRNVGELSHPAISVEVANPVCGDLLRLSARLEQGIVTAVAFKSRGCTASIAAASALTTLMDGRSIDDLKGISAANITDILDGLPPASAHAAALAMDALRALLRVLK